MPQQKNSKCDIFKPKFFYPKKFSADIFVVHIYILHVDQELLLTYQGLVMSYRNINVTILLCML